MPAGPGPESRSHLHTTPGCRSERGGCVEGRVPAPRDRRRVRGAHRSEGVDQGQGDDGRRVPPHEPAGTRRDRCTRGRAVVGRTDADDRSRRADREEPSESRRVRTGRPAACPRRPAVREPRRGGESARPHSRPRSPGVRGPRRTCSRAVRGHYGDRRRSRRRSRVRTVDPHTGSDGSPQTRPADDDRISHNDPQTGRTVHVRTTSAGVWGTKRNYDFRAPPATIRRMGTLSISMHECAHSASTPSAPQRYDPAVPRVPLTLCRHRRVGTDVDVEHRRRGPGVAVKGRATSRGSRTAGPPPGASGPHRRPR